jgi:hypothetical protein
MSAVAQKADDAAWVDIRQLGVEGQGWSDTARPFDRLPARAEKLVRPPVWSLSRHSAGLCVRFMTDAPAIDARWTLTSPSLSMTHMPATGVSGLDLYVKDPTGKWRWLAVGQPKTQSNTAKLVSGLPVAQREYLLYLPLYNGVSSVEISVPAPHKISKAPAYADAKPIIFYGTSITQGGCASRPGMVHTAILGRWLDHPVINLGFSGNGRMEQELADLMAELDPSIYVLDCLPNMAAKEVAERVEPFVRTLRKAHASTPIVLVEDRSYANSHLVASSRQRNLDSRRELKAAYERLQKAGVSNLHYLSGEDLIGDDNEGTVDSSHPTDLGFFRQAEAFARVLRPLVSRQR